MISTYNMTYRDKVDWRLSKLVTRASYEQIKKDYGVSAVIYGIPVGANYDDFENRADRYLEMSHEALTHDQQLNVAWTGLSAAAESAYSKCIQSQVLMSDGLHAVVRNATVSDITILLKWHRTGYATPLHVNWLPSNVFEGVHLPTTVEDGSTTILIPRPGSERQLVANGSGFTTEGIVVGPAPPPPPPIPTLSYVCKKPLTLHVTNNSNGYDNYTTYYAYESGDPWRYTLEKDRWGLGDSDRLRSVDVIPPVVGDISVRAMVSGDVVKFEPRSSKKGSVREIDLRVTYISESACQ